MPNYIIAYYGGKKPETPEEGAKEMKKWKAWIEGLGDAVVNPGTPLGKSKIVSKSGISDNNEPNSMTGYSTLKADTMDDALEMAKTCPFLDMGTIQVAEEMEM